MARVARHCRNKKALHWHVDYLRQIMLPIEVWYTYDPERREHQWAEALASTYGLVPFKGFGSGDCSCYSHLFHVLNRPEISVLRVKLSGQGDVEVCAEGIKINKCGL